MIRPPSALLTAAVVASLGLASGAALLASLPAAAPSFSPMAVELLQRSADLAWLLIICAALGLALEALRLGFIPSPPLALLPLLAAALACYLFLNRCQATKTAAFAAAPDLPFFWLDDDAMISMRYARNMALGFGPRWNANDASVEGYTNPLWMALMAIPHLFGVPQRLAALPILAVNGITLAAIIAAAWSVARRMGLSISAASVSLALLASNRWLIHWAAGGSEALPLTLALLLLSVSVLKASRARPIGWQVGLLAGLACLLRADAPAILLGFLPALAILFRSRRARPSAILLACAIPAAHLILRLACYGEWLPNTYHLKAVDVPMRPAMGLLYLCTFLFGPSAFGALCALQSLHPALARRRPLATSLAALPWVALAYCAFIGGDELPEMRFLVPVVPLFILGAVGAAELAVFGAPAGRLMPPPPARLPGGWTTLTLLLGLLAYPSLCLPSALAQLGMDRGRIERRNVEIGLLLNKNTSPEAKIAHFWAGAAPYFSDRPAQDMLGKNDAHIARLSGHPGEWPPGHVKYDPAYSMSLAPDVVVTALPADRLDPAIRAKDPDRLVYPGLYALYDDPTFKGLYEPGLVALPLSRDFHAIFVRKGSTAARPPADWAE